jgi:hypothetical protein
VLGVWVWVYGCWVYRYWVYGSWVWVFGFLEYGYWICKLGLGVGLMLVMYRCTIRFDWCEYPLSFWRSSSWWLPHDRLRRGILSLGRPYDVRHSQFHRCSSLDQGNQQSGMFAVVGTKPTPHLQPPPASPSRTAEGRIRNLPPIQGRYCGA